MIPESIGQFRIQGRLGEGGMGEVYLAYDERLRRPVAIKRIRSAELADETARARFKREALTNARLSHPAIVHLYDFQDEDDPPVIVMEYVEGETLGARLAGGPLAPEEALRPLREIADGVAYAHELGVVHRDLKASNVMLTLGGHAKILDFGLAKALAGLGTTLSQPGAVAGTPESMSPEQARGQEVDHRTDLFSLGVLFYHVLTGISPFRGESKNETYGRVSSDYRPPPAESVRPEIPAVLSDLIDSLLEKDPSRRPQSARDVVRVLDGLIGTSGTFAAGNSAALPGAGSAEPPDPARPPTRRSRPANKRRDPMPAEPAAWWFRHRALGLGLALAVLIIGISIYAFWPRPPKPADVPWVVLLAVDNHITDNELAWLGTAFTEMFQLCVEADQRAVVVERRWFGDIASEESLADAEWWRREFTVDVIVTAKIEEDSRPGAWRFNLEIRDHKGETTNPISGTAPRYFEPINRACDRLREHLGFDEQTAQLRDQIEQGFLPPEMAGLYFRGLERLEELYDGKARLLFAEARQAAPDDPHPLLEIALAETLVKLGEELPEDAGQRIRDDHHPLPPRSAAEIEARYLELVEDWDGAVEIYQTLYGSFKYDIDIGLRLARVQEPTAALATLEQLRELPFLPPFDPRIDIAEALVHDGLRDPERTRRFAQQAIYRAERAGSEALVAFAKVVLANALTDLGELGNAAKAYDEALAFFESKDNKKKLAEIYMGSAVNWSKQGDLVTANRFFERCERTARELEDREMQVHCLINLGINLERQGALAEAKERYEKALDGRRNFEILINLGGVLQRLGELDKAEQRYAEARDLNEDDIPVLTNLGEIQILRDLPKKAVQSHQEALGLNEGDATHERIWLALALALDEKREDALRHYDKSVKDLRGDSIEDQEDRLELAFVALQLGKHEDAGWLARESADAFRRIGMIDHLALARVAESWSLIRRDQIEEARALAGAAGERAESENARVRFEVAILTAHLRGLDDGGLAEARAALESVAREASGLGMALYGSRARAELTELDEPSKPPGAR